MSEEYFKKKKEAKGGSIIYLLMDVTEHELLVHLQELRVRAA